MSEWCYEGRRRVNVLVLEVRREEGEVHLLDIDAGLPFIADCRDEKTLEGMRAGQTLEVEIDVFYSEDSPEAERVREMSGGVLDRAYRFELVSARPLEVE
jgi:hypothetical protein